VDDATAFLAKFAPSKRVAPGAYATIEATRLAPGHKNYNRWEVNGTEGSIAFCFERMNELEYCNRNDPADKPGFKTIMVTEGSHPYVGAWWPPGHVIGYEHTFIHTVADFVTRLSPMARCIQTSRTARNASLLGGKCQIGRHKWTSGGHQVNGGLTGENEDHQGRHRRGTGFIAPRTSRRRGGWGLWK
jgi:predicted dehydrogenase